MSETPPRLASNTVEAERGYSPLSWTSVVAVCVGSLFPFILILIFLGVRKGQPVIEPWLLFFPALTLILAFVARRQIDASEGTRTDLISGVHLTVVAWWMGILGGVGYGAYLMAIEYAIRSDAEKEFVRWAELLKDLDPKNPKDPNLYSAIHFTLSPGERSAVSPKDPVGMDRARANEVLWFRQVDLVRICLRNRGQITIIPQGVKDWQQRPSEIACTLTATLTCPEGDFGLVVPMKAVIEEGVGRRWQVGGTSDGFIKTKKLSQYGWLVERIEADARTAWNKMQEVFAISTPSPIAGMAQYLGSVAPGWTADSAEELLVNSAKNLQQTGAIAGAWMRPDIAIPMPANWKSDLVNRVFAKPDGSPMSAEQINRLLGLWNTPGRILPGGMLSKAFVDVNPILIISEDRIDFRQPLEIPLGNDLNNQTMARGRAVLTIPRSSAEDLYRILDRSRKLGVESGLTSSPPSDLPSLPVINWRLDKLETDLRAVPINQEQSQASTLANG